MPLLKKLVNRPFGGETPFSAEIYYVNKTSKLDMAWGTANPFEMEDPKYGLILSIRSHGKYGMRIADSRIFVNELIGAIPKGATVNYLYVAKYFSGLLASKMKAVISSFMIRKKISFLEITAYFTELSQECEHETSQEFGRYGIEIVNFFIETISVPEEQLKKLREYKEKIVLGKDFYCGDRSFNVLESLANHAEISSEVLINTQNLFSDHSVPSEELTCPHCNSKNSPGQTFCGYCGQKMSKVCTNCNSKNAVSQNFCGKCGAKL